MQKNGYPNVVATSASLRAKGRRIVSTPDGLFVVRKVGGLDFLESNEELLRESVVQLKGATENAREAARQKIVEETSKNVASLTTVMLTRGVVAATIYESGAKDDRVFTLEDPGVNAVDLITHESSRLELAEEPQPDAVSAYDLSEDTIVIIMNAIRNVSGTTATTDLETRLKSFRNPKHNDDRETSEAVRETTKRDLDASAR